MSSCPPGYTLDGRTGYCVAPCQGGYSYFQGECIQQCPANTRVNDQKLCVRPTFSRAMFTSESLQQTVQLFFGGQINDSGKLLIGTPTSGDLLFTEVPTNGPVKKILKRASGFSVFEDVSTGVPVQTFTISGTTVSPLTTPSALGFTDVNAATYLPYSDSFVISSSPTQLRYLTNTNTTSVAYDAAQDAEEDEVLVFTGGKPTISGSGESGGLITTDGAIQIGSKRTNGNANMDDFTLIYDVKSRNLGGLLYSGTDTKVRYTYRGTGANTILTISNSTNYEVSDVFRFDSPFGTDLSDLNSFTAYVFVRKTDFETPSEGLSFLYENRSYADIQNTTASWKQGPILPENPKSVTITGSTFTSPVSLPSNSLVYDLTSNNTYYTTVAAGTSGSVIPLPMVSRTAKPIGPKVLGISMAYQDPASNFMAFATKSSADIPNPTALYTCAVTFSTLASASLVDFQGADEVGTPVSVGAKTVVSTEAWNGNKNVNQWTPVQISVPAGVSLAYVSLWGAGGNNDTTNLSNAGTGGAGGFVSASLNVTGLSTLTVLVGMGGDQRTGVALPFLGGVADGGSGGGRSAIQTGTTDLVTAGGGGGAKGGGFGGAGGPGGSISNGLDDSQQADTTVCGTGAPTGQNASDSSTDPNAISAGPFRPGQSSYFAGGGGGYFGGGCAGGPSGGAGGGASYAGSLCSSVVQYTAQDSSRSIPFASNSNYPSYRPAKGGDSVSRATEGFVLIQFVETGSGSTNTISRELYLSKSPTWMTSLPTLDFATSTLNGNSLGSMVTNLAYAKGSAPGNSNGVVLAATDVLAIPYVNGTSYVAKTVVKYEGTQYTASVPTSGVPGLSTDWVESDNISFMYCTTNSTTGGFFDASVVNFQSVMLDSEPLLMSGLNSIRVYPDPVPTFVLMGDGYRFLRYTGSGWTQIVGSFSGFEATEFQCIDGGYEAGQNSFVLAAVPKSLSVGFSFQTPYAPSFSAADISNPMTGTLFSKQTLFATNGSVTVAVGGPLQRPTGSYSFTGYNVCWQSGSLPAYLSFLPGPYTAGTASYTQGQDIRYAPSGSYTELPLAPTNSIPFFSPANLLITADGRSYRIPKDSRPSPPLTNYMMTFFNSVLPNGVLQTAQFTDVAYIALTQTTGYFMAVGNALWDLNSLADATFQILPTNVIWTSNVLTSLSDIESASLWKPMTVTTNNGSDPIQGVKIVQHSVGDVPYLVTSYAAYKLTTVDHSNRKIVGSVLGTTGLFPAVCVPVDGICEVCSDNSYAESIYVQNSTTDTASYLSVCIDAISQDAANTAADTLNGFLTPIVVSNTSTIPLTIPKCSSLAVELWGSGGTNGTSGLQNGGGGGYVSAIVSATSSTGAPAVVPVLTYVLGQPGGNTSSTGFGMKGTISSGGGYSGIFYNGVPLLIAPGGGGGGTGSASATGGGGGSSGNLVLSNGTSDQSSVPDSTQVQNGQPAASPSASTTIYSGAGGGYPVGTPGSSFDGSILGASGGAFYPPNNFTYKDPSGLVLTVVLVRTETGGTLPIGYTSVKAQPGGTESPNWDGNSGSTNTSGSIVVVPQTQAEAFLVNINTGTSPVVAVGLSQWKNTLSDLLPVPSTKSLLCPLDPGFQVSGGSTLSLIGQQYSSFFTKQYKGTVSVSNTLTANGYPNPDNSTKQQLVTFQDVTTTSLATTSLVPIPLDDVVALPVYSKTSSGTISLVSNGPPVSPSATGTMPQHGPTNVTYTLTTVPWNNASGAVNQPTNSNYISFGTTPQINQVVLPVYFDSTMQGWKNFGSLYVPKATPTSGTTLLIHGPGDSSLNDICDGIAGVSPALVPSPLGYLPTAPGSTVWNTSTSNVTPSATIPPDPILTLGFQAPVQISTSLQAMITTNFFRPRNWAFVTDFSITGASTTLFLQNTLPDEFANPDPDASSPGTDFAYNSIVGLGRYPMYALKGEKASTLTTYWPPWQGLQTTSFQPGVTYSLRPNSFTCPSVFHYIQQIRPFDPVFGTQTTTTNEYVFYIFLKVDTPNYLFKEPGTIQALSATVTPSVDGSTSTVTDKNGNVFDPMEHYFFIDPLQTFSNLGFSRSYTASQEVWNLASLNILFQNNSASSPSTTGHILPFNRPAAYYQNANKNLVRLYCSQNHVVGLTQTPIYDTLESSTFAVGPTVTATQAYVCYAYKILVPTSLSNGSNALGSDSLGTPNTLDSTLLGNQLGKVNVNGLSLNVECLPGGTPQLQSQVISGTQFASVEQFMTGSATTANPVDTLQFTQGLAFTRFMKDPLGLSAPYYSLTDNYFPVPVTFPNVHYSPQYTLCKNRAGFQQMLPDPTVFTILDPSTFFVSENLLGGNPPTFPPSGLSWLDYASLNPAQQNMLENNGPLWSLNSSTYLGYAVVGTNNVPVSGLKYSVNSISVLALAPAVMSSFPAAPAIPDGLRSWDHETSLSVNNYLPSIANTNTNVLTLNNLSLPSDGSPYLYGATGYPAVQTVQAITFYIDAPSPGPLYVCNLQPLTTQTNRFVYDNLFTYSSTTAVYSKSAQYAALASTFTPNPYPLDGGNYTYQVLTGGYGGGTNSNYGSNTYNNFEQEGGILPSQKLQNLFDTNNFFKLTVGLTTDGTSGQVYFDNTSTANAPMVATLLVNDCSAITTLQWDYSNNFLGLSSFFDRTYPDNIINKSTFSSNPGSSPPKYNFQLLRLLNSNTALPAGAPLSVSLNVADPLGSVNQIIGVLNRALSAWNYINDYGVFRDSEGWRAANTNPNTFGIFPFTSTNDGKSYLIENFFDYVKSSENYYLRYNFKIGVGNWPYFNDITNFQSNCYSAVDFRFCDPFTRKLLGVSRSTRILSKAWLQWFKNAEPDTFTYSFVCPDPIDLSVGTKVAHLFSATGTEYNTTNDTESPQIWMTQDKTQIPCGRLAATIVLKSSSQTLTSSTPLTPSVSPCNVDPIYTYTPGLFKNLGTLCSAVTSSSVVSPSIASAIQNGTPIPYLPAADLVVSTTSSPLLQTVSNFNGFQGTFLQANAQVKYTFVDYQWIFWPWSNRRDMTLYQIGSTTISSSLSTSSAQDEPEFTALPTLIYVTSPFSTKSVTPTTFSLLEGTPYAVVGTSFGDLRLLDVETGQINVASSAGAFTKRGRPASVSNILETFVLGTDILHYFVLTSSGLFTTFHASNTQSDIQQGVLNRLTFVPVFDTSGSAALPVSGTQTYLATLTIQAAKVFSDVLVVSAKNGTTSVLVFLWLVKTKLLYSVATVPGVTGVGLVNDLLLVNGPSGLSFTTAGAYWNTSKTGNLSFTKSSSYIVSATIGLPDYTPTGVNDIVTILNDLETTLGTELQSQDFYLDSGPNATYDALVPLNTQSWNTFVSLEVFYNASPPPGRPPGANIEGVSFFVTFSDVSPFSLSGTPAFPISGLLFDTVSQNLLNYGSEFVPFQYQTSATQSILESEEFPSDSYPNFFRNVFFKIQKSGTGTLSKFFSTARNRPQMFSDSIITGATEVNANLIISDVAYSPETNILLWLPRGTFGATKSLYATSVSPGVALTGIGTGPTFGTEAVCAYNPYLLNFLVAGKGPNLKIFLLNVASTPVWTEVLSGTKVLASLAENMDVTCVANSPSSECLAGSLSGKTALWYRLYQNSSWQKAIFEQPGFITAISFVGFGWYLCTWDPSIKTDQGFGLSSLWFASSNFTVIVYVDAWDAVDRTVKVNTIAYTNSAQDGVCPDGYEQSSDNPNICYKVCPDAYEGLNDLCAMRCPPGFATGNIPQFCYPSRYTPARTHPVRPNMRNTISVPQTSDFNANVGPEANTSTAIKWAVGVSSAVALGGALAISLLK